jgi:hypothetical protein
MEEQKSHRDEQLLLEREEEQLFSASSKVSASSTQQQAFTALHESAQQLVPSSKQHQHQLESLIISDSKQQQQRQQQQRKSPIFRLSHELVVEILTFLRAYDIATCREVDKTLFSPQCIGRAVDLSLMYIYTFPQTALSPFPSTGELSKMLVESSRRAVYRLPDVLFTRLVSRYHPGCRLLSLFSSVLKLVFESVSFSCFASAPPPSFSCLSFRLCS